MSKGLKALERYRFLPTRIDYDIVENELKALNEILALHDKWLGNEMSDFEFFTLLSEIKDKHNLIKEELL